MYSKIIFLEKLDCYSTLTTWIYCHFWQMWSAEQEGRDVYINWPEGKSLKSYHDKEMFAKQPNMFEWYFKQPKVEGRPPRQEVWTWEGWKDKTPGLMAQPLEVIRDYYKRYLKFSDVVEERGQELVKKYNIDFSKTIGISWRGTDIYLDGRPYIPIEKYYPFIDEMLEPGMRIMCTAEEKTILDPLLNRYQSAFVIDEFESAPKGGLENPERHSARSGFERGLQPALMVWLFSKCAHYIKNRSSTGAVASWLSDGRIVSIGHPENLGFPANIPFAEIKGKLYPI